MNRLLRRDQSVPREIDGGVPFDDVMEKNAGSKSSMVAPQWSFDDWISTLAKG